VACGTAVDPESAREYDKYGDRWDRDEKRFEHLCRPCHRAQCHQPRKGLEATLVSVGAGERSRESFLSTYCSVADAPDG
jgi:hypothetical protein